MGIRGSTTLLAAAAILVLLVFPSLAAGCPNDALRVGPSAGLPDCRAFELVTPADTNGAPPRAAPGAFRGVEFSGRHFFPTSPTADGDQLLYLIGGTDLPGGIGNGIANVYEATRTPDGWRSALDGPTGAQSTEPALEGASPDLSATAYDVFHSPMRYGGTLDLGASPATGYYQVGHGQFRLVGEGTLPAIPDEDGFENGLADEPAALVDWLSPGGHRVIFETAVSNSPTKPARLLPDAPPNGIGELYEAGEEGLRTVAVLPGDLTPTSSSTFAGATPDGTDVVFTNGANTYVRINQARTAVVAEGHDLFAGIAADGRRIFYVDGGGSTVGNLDLWEMGTEKATPIVATGDARFVNISADGSHVYFISPSQIVHGLGTVGQPNLYVWSSRGIRYIATLAGSDLSRPGGETQFGLALWQQAVRGQPLLDTSRTNPSGTGLVFESSARLTTYDNSGVTEVYLYSSPSETLTCVSCDPGGAPPTGDALLTSHALRAVGSSAVVRNLSDDGSTVVFQTASSLVETDRDSQTDVYEWREGKLALLSPGDSPQGSLLLAVSPNAHDVFFRTPEALVAEPQNPRISAIYDARIDGGFASPAGPPAPCSGEACRPESPPPPALPPLPSASPKHRPRCAHRHRAAVRRHGSSRGQRRRRCGKPGPRRPGAR